MSFEKPFQVDGSAYYFTVKKLSKKIVKFPEFSFANLTQLFCLRRNVAAIVAGDPGAWLRFLDF